MTGWIAVADELPPLGVPVVLFDGQSAYCGERYCDNGGERCGERWWMGIGDTGWTAASGWGFFANCRVDLPPTHWHRLPDPSEVMK